METILLTGGTGCVGSHILEELAQLDDIKVKLLVRTPSKFDNLLSELEISSLEWEIIEGDLGNFELIEDIMPEIDTVFHVAAVFDFKSKWEKFERINVDGTRVIIDAMRPGTNFILTSSDGVYGFPDLDEPLTEDQEYNPFGNYQRSKMLQEDLARQRCAEKGIHFVAIRPTNIVGPRDSMTVPRIINSIEDRSMVLINGGKKHISIVHPRDVAKAHVSAYQHIDEVDGEAFHIASINVLWKDYLDTFAEELDIEPISRSIPYFLGYVVGLLGDLWPGESVYSRFNIKLAGTNRILDVSKLEQLLGFTPQYNLDDIVKESVAWYRNTYS